MINDRRSPIRRKPFAAVLIVLVAIAAFAVVAYAYASPYLVLDRLKRAVDARDVETVNQYVDYPALRISLKQQLTELLARRIGAQKREHPFAALGALIGMALIGPLVDNYATPDGVAALLNGMPPRGEPGEAPPASSGSPSSSAGEPGSAPAAPQPGPSGNSPSEPAPATPRQTSAGYRSIDEFVVTYRPNPASAPYSVILLRDGWFSWRLAAVDLSQQ